MAFASLAVFPRGVLLLVCLLTLMVASEGLRMDASFLAQVSQTLLNGSNYWQREISVCSYETTDFVTKYSSVRLQSVMMSVTLSPSNPTVKPDVTFADGQVVDLGDVVSGQQLWYNKSASAVSSGGSFGLRMPSEKSGAAVGLTGVNCSVVSEDELTGYDSDGSFSPTNFVSAGVRYSLELPLGVTNMEVARATFQGENIGKCCASGWWSPDVEGYLITVEYGGKTDSNVRNTKNRGTKYTCVPITEFDPVTPCRVFVTTGNSPLQAMDVFTIYAAAPDPPASTTFWTTGAIVGVAVGCGVGIVLCVGLGWRLAKRRALLRAQARNEDIEVQAQSAQSQYRTFA